jgi:hypothetical protein
LEENGSTSYILHYDPAIANAMKDVSKIDDLPVRLMASVCLLLLLVMDFLG